MRFLRHFDLPETSSFERKRGEAIRGATLADGRRSVKSRRMIGGAARTQGEVPDEQAKAETEAQPDEGGQDEGDEAPEEDREEEGWRGAGRAAPARGRKRTTATRRGKEGAEDQGRTVGLLREVLDHHETGPAASAGDLDADWQRAESRRRNGRRQRVHARPGPGGRDRPRAGGGAALDRAVRASEETLEDRDRRYWNRAPRAGQGERAGRALTGYLRSDTRSLIAPEKAG